MKYTATALSDDSMTISEIVLTPSKLVVDYDDEVGSGHLSATSTDGIRYTGNYGYPEPESNRRVWLDVYRRKDGRIALIGDWQEGTNIRYPWIMVLDPVG